LYQFNELISKVFYDIIGLLFNIEVCTLIITEQTILNAATSYETYVKGKQYYVGGNIFKFHFDPEKLMAHAKVSGRRDYDVHIALNDEGVLTGHYCDCPAFEGYNGSCKHIIAVLKKVQEILPQYNKRFKKPIQDDFFNFFNNPATIEKEEVRLEVTLGIENPYKKELCSFLELKIGKRYLYSVKSIKNLIQSMKSGTPIEYGKKFTFVPYKHKFSKIHRGILDILKELYEIENLSKDFSSQYIGASIFKGKRVYFPSSSTQRILELLNNEIFLLKINEKEYEIHGIEEGKAPIEFELRHEEKYLALQCGKINELILLDEEGNYFFYQEKVYKLNSEQKRYMKLLYNELKNTDTIYVQEEQKERFVSEILPAVNLVGAIEIDKEVENSLYQVELEAEIYLDQGEEGIKAEIIFCYGDAKINPFSDEQTKRVENKIVVRDIEKENRILTYFEEMEFKVSKNYLYLDGEEKFFKFIYEIVPELQKLSQVYYSESFKNIKVKDPSLFSIGIRLNETSDMLEISFDHQDIDRDELWRILTSLKERKKYYRLKNGDLLPLESNTLEAISRLVDYFNLDQDDLATEIIELPKYRALYLDEEIKESHFNQIKRNQAFKRLVQNVREPEDLDLSIPKEMETVLRDYQKTGYKWLKALSAYGFGGILADDMGLGKTLQTLTFLLSERDGTPSLIVAPTSLVYNWKDEAEKFVPELKVVIVSGNKHERTQFLEDIKDVDVVITSYALIRRDIDLYKEIKFKYCILDEAQHIKNPSSLNAMSVKKIKASGYYALTGTPIENSLTELWSIFDFILPGYLFSHRQFVEKYEKPIIKNQDKNALKQLQKQIKPFILRRMKKDVLKELPEKIESKMIAELTEAQKKIYFAYVEKARGELAKEIAEKGYERSHIKILSILTRLRQICCHPASFLEDYKEDTGKMMLLEEIVEELLEGGHRTLIFSQFTSMLQIIGEMLKRKDIRYFYLDGSTPAEERGEMVKRFNKGENSIFLISLKAGGTGLNLTGADTVIHFDPWWNPAVEDQAADRAYRIGQKNAVQVIKLITKGTIEEKIYHLQQKKREMIESVIHPGESMLSKMTEDEIMELLEINKNLMKDVN
jgi:SNF2 family DNA or RNA helicase